MFCFSNFVKILKDHSNDKTISDEKFMNSLFSEIFCSCNSNSSEEFPYKNKDVVSRIMNKREDMPLVIRKTLLNSNLNDLNDGLKFFYKDYINKDELNHLVSSLSDLYINDKTIPKTSKEKLSQLEQKDLIISFLLIETAKTSNNIINKAVNIFKIGDTEVNYIVCDFLNFIFKNKFSKTLKIAVIPVDTNFKVHVSNINDTSIVVSPNTIHGKWVNKMKENGFSERDLLEQLHKENGKIGDIIPFQYNNIIFYLLAISKFNERNVAYSSKIDIENSIVSLLNYYNERGLSYDLYLPLIGTGSSRAKLSYIESFNLILNTIKNNLNIFNGKINIVIYDKNYEKMEDFLNGFWN